MMSPKWWDATLTIYNKYEDPDTNLVSWYKAIVNNCFWKYQGDKVVIGQTILESNTTICRIGKSNNFVEKHVWNQLEDKSSKFTLAIGDIIIKGSVDDEVDEYTSGKRSTDLLNKYKENQGCIIVNSISLNDGIARNNKHYLVRGS